MKLLIGPDGSITEWDRCNPDTPECAICNEVIPHTKLDGIALWCISQVDIEKHLGCVRTIYKASTVCN